MVEQVQQAADFAVTPKLPDVEAVEVLKVGFERVAVPVDQRRRTRPFPRSFMLIP